MALAWRGSGLSHYPALHSPLVSSPMAIVFGTLTTASARTVLLLVVALVSAQVAQAGVPLSASEQAAVVQLLDLFPSLTIYGPTSPWNRSAVANICDYSGSPNWFTCDNGSIKTLYLCVWHCAA